MRPGFLPAAVLVLAAGPAPAADGWYFPPPGKADANQDRRQPAEVGLNPAVVGQINGFIAANPYAGAKAPPRWALWRHGRLVHVEGDFHKTVDVASLRKTWHAMIVGAAVQQGRIPSVHQRLSPWLPELKGNHALATWRDVLTQSAGFDYPHGRRPAYRPGEVWTYSDLNLIHLCHAEARAFGRKDYRDDFAAVAKAAYFDAIGLEGWSTRMVVDGKSGLEDGVRFVISLEHMGRLGLLALARGRWKDEQLVPEWFVRDLETKQTYGSKANYDGPNDGKLPLDPKRFPEAPYGYLTWVNSDGDYFPGADRGWAWGSGAGGTKVLWNASNGLVFAGVSIGMSPSGESLPHLLEKAIAGPDPLVSRPDPAPVGSAPVTAARVGRWERFEAAVENAKTYADPFRDVTLDVTYTRPDGSTVRFWGFHDGTTWKLRFMPDQLGAWKYSATFSDGTPGKGGTFECVPSGVPGMVSTYEPNPIWFGFRDGRGGSPFPMRSFHVGDRFFAANWPAEKRTAFLDWAEGQGYNTLSVASHYLNRDAEGRGKGWDTPKLWPPAPAEYREVEAVLDDLGRRRMAVFPFAGFFGRASNAPTDPKDQELYVRYTLARFGPYWNALLNVGGPEPLLRNKSYLTREQVNDLGRLIRKLDVFGHPLTVHNRTGDDEFKDADWLTYGTLQGPKTTDRAKLGRELLKNHHPAKPLYAQETLWVRNTHGHPHYSETDLRKNGYVLALSAAALNFGDMEGDSSSGFSGGLDLKDKVQARHDIERRVWDFFESVPYYRMRPRPDLVTAGHCLADEGRDYLVYLDASRSVDVAVRGGPYRVEWASGRDPADRRAGGTTPDGKGLTPPPGGDDWLLRLTAAGDGRAVLLDDPLTGKTVGTRPFDRGEFTADGWAVTTPNCQIKYDLGRLVEKATAEFEMKGKLDQEEKRVIFSAWNTERGNEEGEADPGFFHVRLMDEGMLLRITYRGGGGRLEKHTGVVRWPAEDQWVKVRANWDTTGGVCRLWIDGTEVRHGTFRAPKDGFRWVFLGKDNYGKSYHSPPGVSFRNLKVLADE